MKLLKKTLITLGGTVPSVNYLRGVRRSRKSYYQTNAFFCISLDTRAARSLVGTRVFVFTPVIRPKLFLTRALREDPL